MNGYTDWNWLTPELAQGAYPDRSAFRHFDMIAYCAREMEPDTIAPHGREQIVIALRDDPTEMSNDERVSAMLAARRVATRLVSGRKVLVTCAAGVNRSGLVAGLAMVLAYEMNGDDAIARIRRKRKPENGMTPLSNPLFVDILRGMR